MATIGFSSARSITTSANPPRTVFVDLPLGHTTGLPHDAAGQRTLLSEGLTVAHAFGSPGSVVDLGYRFVDDHWKESPLGWSRKRQDGGKSGSNAGDTRTPRSDEPVYQTDDDRQAADATPDDIQCLSCLGINV